MNSFARRPAISVKLPPRLVDVEPKKSICYKGNWLSCSIFFSPRVVGHPLLPLEEPEHPAERRHDRLLGLPDQMGEDLAEGGSGLLKVVVGDLGEQVVDLEEADR